MTFKPGDCLREVCSDLLEALGPPDNRTSVGVGEGLLRECLGGLMQTEEIGQRERSDWTEGVLRGLQALADEQINSIDFHMVPTRWLALYTDVSLARALHRLWFIDAANGSKQRSVDALEAVRLLDMALIIAGGCGEGRLSWIHQTIRCAQAFLAAPQDKDDDVAHGDRPSKRRKVAAGVDPDPSILFAPKHVPVLPRPPTVSAYTSRHSESPFVLRQFTTSGHGCPTWDAISKWSDPTYILSCVGEGRHVPVEIGSAYSDRNWGQRIVHLREFLTQAGFFGNQNDDREDGSKESPMYLAQHSLFRQFPQLERDIALPDYVWSAPSPPADYPTYAPPSNREGVITNVWIGSGSSTIVSPAHTDPYFNCFAQVLGTKRVWLAPPSCGPYMSPHGQSTVESAKTDSSGEIDVAAAYMGNTSTFPLLRDGYDKAKLMNEFPSFAEHVWPHAMETVLYPGDLLVMPPGWWHAMRGEREGPGWSVSMWY